MVCGTPNRLVGDAGRFPTDPGVNHPKLSEGTAYDVGSGRKPT